MPPADPQKLRRVNRKKRGGDSSLRAGDIEDHRSLQNSGKVKISAEMPLGVRRERISISHCFKSLYAIRAAESLCVCARVPGNEVAGMLPFFFEPSANSLPTSRIERICRKWRIGGRKRLSQVLKFVRRKAATCQLNPATLAALAGVVP